MVPRFTNKPLYKLSGSGFIVPIQEPDPLHEPYFAERIKGVSACSCSFMRRIASFRRRNDPKTPPTNCQRCKPVMGFWRECPFCIREVQCNPSTLCSTVEYPRFFWFRLKKRWLLHSTALSTHERALATAEQGRHAFSSPFHLKNGQEFYRQMKQSVRIHLKFVKRGATVVHCTVQGHASL
jgi:hypothetical protein